MASTHAIANESMSPRPARRRWRFRFGLKTLLVIVTVCAACFGALGVQVRRHAQQVEAVKEILAADCMVEVKPGGWPWLRRCVDPDRLRLFETVEVVYLAPIPEHDFPNLSDDQLAQLVPAVERLPRLSLLILVSNRVTNDGLMHLSRFKHLETLDLRAPLVTDEGTRRLEQALPNLRIHDD